MYQVDVDMWKSNYRSVFSFFLFSMGMYVCDMSIGTCNGKECIGFEGVGDCM